MINGADQLFVGWRHLKAIPLVRIIHGKKLWVRRLNIDRLLKNYRSPFENLRANGAAVEMVEHFPFVLSFVEALLGFQQSVEL